MEIKKEFVYARYIGGENNIIRFFMKGNHILQVAVKDQSLVDLKALKNDKTVADCMLKSGQLQIVLLQEKMEDEERMANKYQDLASGIAECTGGKENVKFAMHCMSRLRLTLKDESIVDTQRLKSLDGVIGCQKVGEQLQIIIGQDVDVVYAEYCNLTGIAREAVIDENLDAPVKEEKKKWSGKRIVDIIFDYLSGSLLAIIPILCGGAVFQVILSIFGPNLLNVIKENSDLFTLLTFVGNAPFYFLPVYIGYSAAKKLGGTPIIGMVLGAILIHPTLVQMAADGTGFSVYGIPSQVNDYSATVIPILLSIPIMVQLEKFFKKYIPKTFQLLFVPFLTIAVMLPIMLCVLAPLGSFLGVYICNGILSLHDTIGIFGIAIVGATFMLLVLTGMHMVLVAQMILLFSTNGCDPFVSVAVFANTAAAWGICIGLAIKGNKELRTRSLSFLIPYVLSGVGEPVLYGLGLRYKKLMLAWMGGGFVGGIVAGLLKVTALSFIPNSSFLGAAAYLGDTKNFVCFLISMAAALVVAAVLSYILGPKEETAV